MPKVITLQDFKSIKEKHKPHWEWAPGVMPEKKYTAPHRAYYRLICGLCKNKYWVNWSNLRKGVSKCCAKCSKLPTLEKMQALVEKHSMRWVPSLIHKPASKSRIFWMKCKGCDKNYWVRWQRFSQGKVKACKSCSRRDHFGSIKDPTRYYKHPIMATWRRIRSSISGRAEDGGWGSFEKFRDWSIDQGIIISLGPVLAKKDLNKPYIPDNCFWQSSKETIRNTIKIKGY